jgi:hypothetical protein
MDSEPSPMVSRLVSPIDPDIDAFDSDQTVPDHRVQCREDVLDLVARVDTLDHDRKVFG